MPVFFDAADKRCTMSGGIRMLSMAVTVCFSMVNVIRSLKSSLSRSHPVVNRKVQKKRAPRKRGSLRERTRNDSVSVYRESIT